MTCHTIVSNLKVLFRLRSDLPVRCGRDFYVYGNKRSYQITRRRSIVVITTKQLDKTESVLRLKGSNATLRVVADKKASSIVHFTKTIDYHLITVLLQE